MRIVKKSSFLAAASLAAAIVSGCGQKRGSSVSSIPASVVEQTCGEVVAKCPAMDASLLQEGVRQAAALWRSEDGTPEEFREFVLANVAADSTAKKQLYEKLSSMLELVWGSLYDISTELLKPVHLDCGPISPIDGILASYNPSCHFADDMFANRTAFATILNFPCWSLAQKDSLGRLWSRQEWAYARLGDVFATRVSAEVQQLKSDAILDADNYIAAYNIKMDHLLSEDGRRLFPEGMSLLSHWNLRDELKSNYAPVPDASEKQEMIYQVMLRIISQEIPQCVIDNAGYDWKPFSNTVYRDGAEVEAEREPDTRYEMVLRYLRACLAEDAFCPSMPSGVQRSFDGERELSAERTESLFISLLEAPQVHKVAALIRERLGRGLRPYDIWYDGFKARSAMPEDELTHRTQALYPDCAAFSKDAPRLLRNLGFSAADAEFIASHIVVEAARGSGHAYPCISRTEPARLRTRVGDSGMDYKGYNISVHEFGHNTEEVLSLYRMDHYLLAGIPNTAFTEAMAFLFQCRDLQLLGYGRQTPDRDFVLDHFWGAYEIMGVSLVDMYMWRWLYAHQDATPSQLREQTLAIARDVWNKYYEPVLGTRDCPILAVYSHIVNSPMYLPNYPLGHLIHFQVEQHLAGCATQQEFARELTRIYTQGRLTPDEWMRRGIGREISVEPMLEAVDEAVKD